ncbi:MAG TPA: SET domain-containing protein-lysine N-methyltransferase [Acidimicrobiia bacterium]|nr:SET domain-containing protein-lysine N-methyltransferase [Acidimicrobiia bacterium]
MSWSRPVQQSWLIRTAAVRPAGGKGLGVFATERIRAGTTVAGFGGHVCDGAQFAALSDELRTHAIQVDDDLYLVSVPPLDPADYVNHSCEPNCGIVGSLLLVAMRDIDVDEELCFDYAMSDTDPYDEFLCACGSESCRGLITGADWQRPELQISYRGFFSAYIEHRIAADAS